MKDHQLKTRRSLWSLGAAVIPALGIAALLAGSNQASANLTVDFRAVSVVGAGIAASAKSVTGVQVGDVVNVQIWAQMTNTGSTGNGRFGMQMLEGNVLTIGSASGITGNATFASLFPSGVATDGFGGFDTGSANGDQNGLQYGGNDTNLDTPKVNSLNDLNGDGSGDIGTKSTATADVTGFLKVASNTAGGYQGSVPKGQQTVFLNSNATVSTTYLNAAYSQGASWNIINNQTIGGNASQYGIELLIGTFHFTITSVPSGGANVDLNWQHAAKVQVGTTLAGWSDGGTIGRTGNAAGAALMFTGSDVVISVPEPATWATLVGGFGLLAFTQRLRRRS